MKAGGKEYSRLSKFYLSDFLPLHLEHKTCKLEGIVFPPLDTGMI